MASHAMTGHRWVEHELDGRDRFTGETRKRWICGICSAQVFNRPDRVPNTQKKVIVVISIDQVEMYSCEEYLIWKTHKE